VTHVSAAECDKSRNGGENGNSKKNEQPAGQGETPDIFCASVVRDAFKIVAPARAFALGSPDEPV
jgi:hypothetical protein